MKRLILALIVSGVITNCGPAPEPEKVYNPYISTEKQIDGLEATIDNLQNAAAQLEGTPFKSRRAQLLAEADDLACQADDLTRQLEGMTPPEDDQTVEWASTEQQIREWQEKSTNARANGFIAAEMWYNDQISAAQNGGE
jgi:hypothetical protein